MPETAPDAVHGLGGFLLPDLGDGSLGEEQKLGRLPVQAVADQMAGPDPGPAGPGPLQGQLRQAP